MNPAPSPQPSGFIQWKEAAARTVWAATWQFSLRSSFHIRKLSACRDFADAPGVDAEAASYVVLAVSTIEHPLDQGSVTRREATPAWLGARAPILSGWTILSIIHSDISSGWLSVMARNQDRQLASMKGRRENLAAFLFARRQTKVNKFPPSI